jgi:hypothetical protein
MILYTSISVQLIANVVSLYPPQLNDKENEERIKSADQAKYEFNRKCVSAQFIVKEF